MTKEYWKALFASPKCGNFILSLPCFLLAMASWPMSGWMNWAGGLFSVPAIIFGHLGWRDSKIYVYPHETFRPELAQPWLFGILLLSYLRAIFELLSALGIVANDMLTDWARFEHQHPGITAVVVFGIGAGFLAREFFCWFLKSNKILEQQAAQLKEVQDLKAKIEALSKEISDIKR